MGLYDINFGNNGATANANSNLTTSTMGGLPAWAPTPDLMQSVNTAISGSGSAPAWNYKPMNLQGNSGWGGEGFMKSIGGLSGIMDGIGSLGQVWMGLQANKIAKQQMQQNTKFANENLKNETQSYNTAVTDRGASRAAYLRDPSYATDYTNKNKITNFTNAG